MAVNEKALALVLGGPKRGRETPPETEAPAAEEESSGLQVAAEDVLSAIESKDAQALVAALKSFVEMARLEGE